MQIKFINNSYSKFVLKILLIGTINQNKIMRGEAFQIYSAWNSFFFFKNLDKYEWMSGSDKISLSYRKNQKSIEHETSFFTLCDVIAMLSFLIKLRNLSA